jgi:hypothetical protein
VTIVILLVFVVVLWIAVLAPSALRRRSERRGVGSIDHFHHQLELLEHAGPKLVAPAYRLHTAIPGGGPSETQVPLPDDLSRPKLVLLRPIGEGDEADVDDDEGAHYQRVGILEPPEPPVCLQETRAELAAWRRQQARVRTTWMLRGLLGVVVLTAFIGVSPSLRPAWIVTGLAGAAALGLVGLMSYARELEMQRRSHRAAADLHRQWLDPDQDVELRAASAGYPGAWDEEYVDYDLPARAAAH